MPLFPLSTVITVSVSGPTPGFAGYNTGNLCIFSDEPTAMSFPSSGIQYYQSPAQVALDFGTSSRTYAESVAVFSQNPNILVAGGQLIIVTMHTATVTWTLSGVAASGAFVASWGGNSSASIPYTSTAAQIQTALQAVPGLGAVTVAGSIAGELLTISMKGVYGATPSAFTFPTNTLETGGSAPITITPAQTISGESITQCLTRVQSLTSFAAVIPNELYETIGATDFPAAATAFQATSPPIMFGVVGVTEANNASPSGVFYENTVSSNFETRAMTYLDNTGLQPLTYLAGYMSRLMSVNWSGSNTALTMNGKQIVGTPPDSVITPGTDFNDAKAAGSDIYISIQGTPFVVSFGANLFADQVTGRNWIQGAIQTAYFNVLAQTSTKIPQTEQGMNIIKSALKTVMNQGVTAGYIAPGQWPDPSNVFGNVADFYANISNYGFYIFSSPIALQTVTQLQTRVAPVVQIAYLEAGAVQSGVVMLLVSP